MIPRLCSQPPRIYYHGPTTCPTRCCRSLPPPNFHLGQHSVHVSGPFSPRHLTDSSLQLRSANDMLLALCSRIEKCQICVRLYDLVHWRKEAALINVDLASLSQPSCELYYCCLSPTSDLSLQLHVGWQHSCNLMEGGSRKSPVQEQWSGRFSTCAQHADTCTAARSPYHTWYTT